MFSILYNNWWLTQIIACVGVTVVNSIFRVYGLSTKIIIFTLPLAIFNIILFCASFEKASSFFQAWFLGNAALAIFGLVVSLIFFDGIIQWKYYLGMALALTGGYLLVT